MPKVRVIQQAPAPVVTSGSGVFRPIAAPTTLSAPQSVAAVPADDRAFMPDAGVADDEWALELERREANDELVRERKTTLVATGAPTPKSILPGSISYAEGPVQAIARKPTTAPLTSLPDRFTLDIERKPDGWWKITAPSVHTGLFIARQDLADALADTPEALAEILRLDGPLPQAKRRKRRDA